MHNPLIRLLILFTFIGILIFFAVYLYINSSVNLFPSYNSNQLTIGNNTYHVYVAETDSQKEKGLSGISKLPSNQGMVFMFDSPGTYDFWMKDMKISLDFIFVNKTMVVGMKEEVSPSSYPNIISIEEPFNSVIELNAGEVKKNGVKVGDSIH